MSITKYNKSQPKYSYNFDKDMKYYNLEELMKGEPRKVHTLKGLLINTKGKYGDSPVAVIEGAFINLPTHLLETVKEMIADTEVTKQINDNKAGFEVYKYVKGNNEYYSVDWMDL